MVGGVEAYARDPRVDAYLDAAPAWQREIMQRVRDLLHEADPEIEETIKRTVQPYFVLQGNVAAFLVGEGPRDVFLYDGGIAPDPEGIITGGHGNQTGRMIADPPGRSDQRAGDARDVPGDHRRQPGRRLAQAQEGMSPHVGRGRGVGGVIGWAG